MRNKYALIFIATVIMIVYYGRIDISQAPYSEIPDIQNYRQMALAAPGIDETVSRNFGYRLLLPYIAGVMPFDVDTNFYIITFILSLMVPIVLFLFLKMYNIKEDTAFFLTLLFLAGRHTFGFPVWDFYDVHDLLTHILILIFFMSLRQNNFIIMAAVLSIGVINRETILFLVPASLYYYVFIIKEKKKILLSLLSFIPAVLIFTLLRKFMVTESAQESGLLYSFGKLRFDETNKLFDPVTYYRIINTFIPLTLIPFVFWQQTKDFFVKNTHFLIFAATYYASCFLAGDTERLIVPVFPVFFLLLGVIFDKFGLVRIKDRIIILSACVLSIPHHLFFRFRLPDRDWKVVISIFTLAFVTYYMLRLKKEKRDAFDSDPDM